MNDLVNIRLFAPVHVGGGAYVNVKATGLTSDRQSALQRQNQRMKESIERERQARDRAESETRRLRNGAKSAAELEQELMRQISQPGKSK